MVSCSLQRVLLVVPMPVLVVLLAPLVCDSTNKAENTSLHIYGSVQKYTSDTNHERTNERNDLYSTTHRHHNQLLAAGCHQSAPRTSIDAD